MSGSASLESAATETGIEIVASLAQHRVLSAAQVRAIHLPASGERWAQRMLARLGDAGLAGYVRSPRSHRRLWHVTEMGARVAREAGALDGEGVAIEQRFLELDRATLSVDRLAAELARYAELHRLTGQDGEPLWRERYPVFPPVHCVLTGGRRSVLERRRATTLAMLGTDPRFTREPEVAVSICLLEDLEREGPFAPIFRDAKDPARPVDWLGGDSDA
jgi:hypothetical protein